MGDSIAQPEALTGSRHFEWSHATAVAGVVVTILAGVMLLMFAQPAVENAAIEAPKAESLASESSGFETARRASPGEVRAYLNDMFDRLDRNGSGFVGPAEAPRRQVTSFRARDGTIRQLPLTQAEWVAQGDADRDGQVSRTEYFAHLVPPVQAIFGVPANWSPGDGIALARPLPDRRGAR